MCKKICKSVSKISIYNKIGEYAESLGFKVEHFSDYIPTSKSILEDCEESVEVCYIHVIDEKNEDLDFIISIFYECNGSIFAHPLYKYNYYELNNREDILRYNDNETVDLYSDSKNSLDKYLLTKIQKEEGNAK